MRISRSRGHSPIASSPGCGSICLPTWGGDAPWLYLPLLLVDMGTRRGMEIDRVHLNPAAGGLASSARRRLGGKRRACGACFPTASQAVFGKRARSKKPAIVGTSRELDKPHYLLTARQQNPIVRGAMRLLRRPLSSHRERHFMAPSARATRFREDNRRARSSPVGRPWSNARPTGQEDKTAG